MFFDPFSDFREMFILLSNVIFFAEIDEVDDRLRCKQEERIYGFNLCGHLY